MSDDEQRVDQSVGGSTKVKDASPGGVRESARKTLLWVVVAVVGAIFLVLVIGALLDR